MIRSAFCTTVVLILHYACSQLAAQSDWLYWDDLDGTHRIKLDGTSLENFPGIGLNKIVPEEGKIYWISDPAFFTLHFSRSNLDGTDVELLFTTGKELHETWSRAFDYDPVEQKIYWGIKYTGGGMQGGWVKRADLDGSNEQLIASGAAVDLDLDPINRKFLFAGDHIDGNSFVANVWRCNLDGTECQLIGQSQTPFPSQPYVHVDLLGGKIYWHTFSRGFRANLDLSNVESWSGPLGIVTDTREEKIYYSSFGRILRANLDGSSPEDFIDPPGMFDTLTSLAILPVPRLVATFPRNHAIDARQPHDLNNPDSRMGWQSIDLIFDNDPSYHLFASVISVVEYGGDGDPPAVVDINRPDNATLRVVLEEPLEPGAWTCFEVGEASTRTCLGFLPGDVNGDSFAGPVDILALIDNLNGTIVPPLELWQTDIDYSGNAAPADILRLLDLLNGAGAYEPWLSRTLPPLP